MLFLLVFISLFSCSEDDSPQPEPEEPKVFTLEVSPQVFSFNAEGSSENLQIKTETDWEIQNELDWISFSEENGESGKTIQMTAETNENPEERSGSFSVISAENEEEIEVSQNAAEETVESTLPPDETDMRNLNSVEMTKNLGVGWNLGNSLDAVGGETAWGNPMVSKQLIDSVKAAGFNAVRIPVAWSKFSDEENFIIQENWMNRVEEVVNYVLDNEMYAVLNIHWDNGWMQPTYDEQDYVNNRLEIMWEQIAIRFRDYNDYLLFAGTNEVMVEGDYSTPTEEYYTVQNSFNQTFVNTVRETGGRNHYRHLVVQGFNTNIDHTINFAEIPEDVIDERLLMEVHYYDPYNFALNENTEVYQWGEDAPESEEWANEAYVDEQFERMKTEFIDNGLGVILGEYGAIYRSQVENHHQYRKAYIEFVTQTALEKDLAPFYWDNGHTGNHGFALFDRETGKIEFSEILEAIIE